MTDDRITLFKTGLHRCSYLPDQEAATIFADPDLPKSPAMQKILSEHGFRRSGELLYRPGCPQCRACVSVRVPVNRFRPNRSQRRTINTNRDLHVAVASARATDEYLALYCNYLRSRHSDEKKLVEPTVEGFLDFFTSPWSDTVFYEFRLGCALVAVAVVDRWPDALSAVYTFFDPTLAQRSLGRFAVLYEIAEAQRCGLSWLYLGYWIAECRKMAYKNEFQPLQYWAIDHWSDAMN